MDTKTRFQTILANIRQSEFVSCGQMIELYQLAKKLGLAYENSAVIYNLNLLSEAKLPKVQSSKLIYDLGHHGLKSRWQNVFSEHTKIDKLLTGNHKQNAELLKELQTRKKELREIAWQAPMS